MARITSVIFKNKIAFAICTGFLFKNLATCIKKPLCLEKIFLLLNTLINKVIDTSANKNKDNMMEIKYSLF